MKRYSLEQFYKEKLNKIYCCDSLTALNAMPDESIDMIITSPPYWSLRDYGKSTKVIWDEKTNCKHQWKKIDNAGNFTYRAGKTTTVGAQLKKDIWQGNKQSDFCSLCGAWYGSLGLEPTFDLYIKHLCDIFDEAKRVLKKTGTVWVNIGDTYSQSGKGAWKNKHSQKEVYVPDKKPKIKETLPAKCLVSIPARFQLEMINRGWILRNIIVWQKPNAMPSSIVDRFTVDFEYLFFFAKSNQIQFWTNRKTGELVSKQPLGIKGRENIDWNWREQEILDEEGWQKIAKERGYSPTDRKARTTVGLLNKYKIKKRKKVSLWKGYTYYFERQFESYKGPMNRWGGEKLKADGKSTWDKGTGQTTYRDRSMRPNKQGRNKRCVWSIPTRPFKGAHFAVFPPELLETPIRAGCPEFICKKCGKPKNKIYKKPDMSQRPQRSSDAKTSEDKFLGFKKRSAGQKYQDWRIKNPDYFIGYAKCNCNAGFRGGIVLDPFIGAGTTALVAKKLERNFIGLELNPDYIKIANKRLKENEKQAIK